MEPTGIGLTTLAGTSKAAEPETRDPRPFRLSDQSAQSDESHHYDDCPTGPTGALERETKQWLS